jgi:low molecular weight phosphotyrosine protein phosphatase
MSEGVFRHLTSHPAHPLIGRVDSAGTAGYHTGAAPDSRTLATLKAKGVSYSHAARQVKEKDFEEFDWIFGMDRDNLYDLQQLRKRVVKKKKGEESGVAEVRLVCFPSPTALWLRTRSF